MKVFVAGATGAIGRPLVTQLLADGHQVFSMTHSPEKTGALLEQGVGPVVVNALDAEAVQAAIAHIQPEVVIEQLTALPKTYTPEAMRAATPLDARIRLEGGANVQAAARSVGVRRYIIRKSSHLWNGQFSYCERCLIMIMTTLGRLWIKVQPTAAKLCNGQRQHLVSGRPRFEVPLRRQEQIVEQFLQACNGDLQGLIALLAEDITLWSDGGGRVTAALKPLYGPVKVAKFLLAIRSQKFGDFTCQIVELNGQPGIMTYVSDRLHSTMTFEITGNRIQSIFIVVNPDKLKQVAGSNLNFCSIAVL